MERLNRRQALARAGKGLGALAAAGGAAGALATSAAAAPSETDLAWLPSASRSSSRASSTGRSLGRARAFADDGPVPERALAAERAHLKVLTDALIAGGGTPIEGVDLEPTFPRGTFGSRTAAARVGRSLEQLSVRTYLGALASVSDAAVRLALVKVVAGDAEHLAFLNDATTGSPVGLATKPILYDLARASDELATFLP
ncbi:MAG: ferritin-like domain-containing protein [Thermoleophilia bacterium]